MISTPQVLAWLVCTVVCSEPRQTQCIQAQPRGKRQIDGSPTTLFNIAKVEDLAKVLEHLRQDTLQSETRRKALGHLHAKLKRSWPDSRQSWNILRSFVKICDAKLWKTYTQLLTPFQIQLTSLARLFCSRVRFRKSQSVARTSLNQGYQTLRILSSL